MRKTSADTAADTAESDSPVDCPWTALPPDGEGLSVHDFLTTIFSQTTNSLRRAITMPYVARFGLSLSEWRVLSVLAHTGTMAFADLAEQAAADKAQVSRTLQLLGSRGLVETEAQGAARRHGILCHMTPAGWALYAEVMPLARHGQADMILALTPGERRVLYSVLRKLQGLCVAGGDPDAK